jgi:hypothetical protein
MLKNMNENSSELNMNDSSTEYRYLTYSDKSSNKIKPEKPYRNEKPNRISMDEKEPITKYFNPASIEYLLYLLSDVSI